jgi:hypothetical protein
MEASMAVNIKVIRTKGVLKTPLTEVLNFTVSKQVLLDIATQIEQPGEYEIWVDSRESDTMVSMVDTDQVDEMLAVRPPLRESKMTLVTSVNKAKQAGSLEPLTWLGEPRTVVATVNIK